METIADASPVVQKTAITSKPPILKRQREVDSENDDEPRHFRRVRMKCRQRARNQDGQDKAESEALSDFGEVTIRCICGAQDNVRTLGNYSDHSLSASMASNLLIQCIRCKVWQHRSCVGAANGNDPPRGYYCEQCQRENYFSPDQSTYHLNRLKPFQRARGSRKFASDSKFYLRQLQKHTDHADPSNPYKWPTIQAPRNATSSS